MFFLQKITLALSFQSGTIISTLVFLRGRPLVIRRRDFGWVVNLFRSYLDGVCLIVSDAGANVTSVCTAVGRKLPHTYPRKQTSL